MAILNYAWPIAMLWSIVTPGYAAPKPFLQRIDCTTGQSRNPAPSEQALPGQIRPGHPAAPVVTLGRADPQTCPVSDQSVNVWMVVMLIAGAIIIGVPAARSRNRHVVFS